MENSCADSLFREAAKQNQSKLINLKKTLLCSVSRLSAPQLALVFIKVIETGILDMMKSIVSCHRGIFDSSEYNQDKKAAV